jgi:hypothetical protein
MREPHGDAMPIAESPRSRAAPAMRGKRVCRLHGGKGGGPRGEKNGAYRTGRYTAEAKAERPQMRALIRELRRMMALASD